jgi:putative phosphonate transport system ATP-binding protein
MEPLLTILKLHKSFGALAKLSEGIAACDNVSFALYPGQVLGIVGESGSGKTTLLNCIAGRMAVDAGTISYRSSRNEWLELSKLSEVRQRWLMRTELGFVHQNPREGLRMQVSAGANIGERLMEIGVRHYGNIRACASHWLQQVEINPDRIDDLPSTFSGGMQQRLQLARVLVNQPRLVLMDEPTGSLDVSVQARLLDLIRNLVRNLHLSVILVTHDIGVVRLLAHRLIVMQQGQIVEQGLTDQVLDDPHHPYTQLLVSATLIP